MSSFVDVRSKRRMIRSMLLLLGGKVVNISRVLSIDAIEYTRLLISEFIPNERVLENVRCQNADLHHYAMQPKVRMISKLLIMVQDSIYRQPGLTYGMLGGLHLSSLNTSACNPSIGTPWSN
jgi:hypothetical protein